MAIAIALSHNAELIIMDEPTSGLDPVFRSEILEIFHDVMLDENKSILFSTHITSDLEKIADNITFIDKGKILLNIGLYSGYLFICIYVKKSLLFARSLH